MRIPLLKPRNDGLVRNDLVAEYKFDKRNLLKYSEDFSNAVWTKTRCSILGNKLTEDSTVGATHLLSYSMPTIPGLVHTIYHDIKAGERQWARISVDGANIGARYFYVNLSNGQTGTNTANIIFRIIALENGVYRCVLTFTAQDVLTYSYVHIAMGDGANSYNGDGVSGIYIYRSQLNLGELQDYQKTTDSQTLWNSKKDSKAVTNLVVNGNFSQGTSGWGALGATLSSINNKLTVTVDATTGKHYTENNYSNPIAGHKYYFRCSIGLFNGKAQLMAINRKTDSNWEVFGVNTGIQNSFLSLIFSPTNLFSTPILITRLQVLNSSGVDIFTGAGEYAEFSNVSSIDLTALFGAGNEPTQAQCDEIFATWFDGTRTMDVQQYNGTLGSTTASDTNDPTWTGQGLSFATDDYVKLPYMINAEQDFTVYLVANVGASVPSAGEYYLSLGNSVAATQYSGITRGVDAKLYALLLNDAGNAGTSSILQTPTSGIRLFAFKRKGNTTILKDCVNNQVSNNGVPPANAITFNQIALGTLLKTTASAFLNQPEYYASFYNRATTDAEDTMVLRYVKALLARRGVKLGGMIDFYADFKGKVSGSTVENGNISKSRWGLPTDAPSSFTSEETTGQYTTMNTLDGSLYPVSCTTNGLSGLKLFSFNLIRDIEDKGVVIPGVALASKIQWCKDNIASITGNWHGYGSSPSGNKATIAFYRVDTSAWGTSTGNTSSAVSKVAMTMLYSTGAESSRGIDSNGFVHLLAYAEPSDGVTASTIYTDYVSLLITLKAGVYL